jgi:ribosomal protein S18 acetylase RimI-like enzyme
MAITFIKADYGNEEQAKAVVDLLDSYARDPMGGGEPLTSFTKDNLIEALSRTPGAFSVLGKLNDEYVALANCFAAFSTFACQPIINIHDLVVSSAARGQGVSQGLLGFVEAEARNTRCCKVTLEVLEGNTVARNAYEKFGFAPYQLDDQYGNALLFQKKL